MIIALVAKKLGLNEDNVATVIAAGLHSAYITFAAMFLGLSIDAVTQGCTTPAALWAYFKAHALAWAITNIAAPAYRSYDAARKNPIKQESTK